MGKAKKRSRDFTENNEEDELSGLDKISKSQGDNNIEETEKESEADGDEEKRSDDGIDAFPNLLNENKKPEKGSKLGLADWLINPVKVTQDETRSLDDLDNLLDKNLIEKCRTLGITELFAVQNAVLPYLLKSMHLYSSRYIPGDICVSAPTGSGKTLAYVLPIIQALSKRIVPRLRALILLPTRDLVTQVSETLNYFASGTDLVIGAVNKKTTFVNEQSSLVENREDDLLGGSSKVDILVITPGRLLDHLNKTKNFTLQHLRYLIIDEADRLLNQQTQDWLQQILTYVMTPPNPPPNNSDNLFHDAVNLQINMDDGTYTLSESKNQLQKLLFSATLTRNPGKISNLKLRDPKYIKVAAEDENIRYVTPKTLKEEFIVSIPDFKPLTLLNALVSYNSKSTLAFTRSVDGAKRLYYFIKEYCKYRVTLTPKEGEESFPKETIDYLMNIRPGYFSSELSTKERKALLMEFKSGKVNLLISSDLMARGLDVEAVEMVVNYDTPSFIKQYIHRVGRTARANSSGIAITLLTSPEVTPFKKMQQKANRLDKIKQKTIDSGGMKLWKVGYKDTIRRLHALKLD